MDIGRLHFFLQLCDIRLFLCHLFRVLHEAACSQNSTVMLKTNYDVCPCCCSEEDIYRDAEEIEREKELLVWGTGTSGTFQYYLCMA